mmetsp:Transcript_17067/g.49450  ORF Transcript_17067/g.49450 Transcript_17067/m.49450 type:complete len:279 (-) Transcript_17067:756-1592(-)
MLEEVRAEVIARRRARVRASRSKACAAEHEVPAVEGGFGEVAVERVGFKGRVEWSDSVVAVLPQRAEKVMVPRRGGLEGAYRGLGRVDETGVGAPRLPGGRGLRAHEGKLRLREQAVRIAADRAVHARLPREEGLGLVAVHDGRPVPLHRYGLEAEAQVEVALLPEGGGARAAAGSPVPALDRPEPLLRVAPGGDEGRQVAICHERARESKWGHGRVLRAKFQVPAELGMIAPPEGHRAPAMRQHLHVWEVPTGHRLRGHAGPRCRRVRTRKVGRSLH